MPSAFSGKIYVKDQKNHLFIRKKRNYSLYYTKVTPHNKRGGKMENERKRKRGLLDSYVLYVYT